MKIAIHHRPGSFSDRWIDYCKQNNIDYVLVNVFDNDIINQVLECDALMWHHHHAIFEDTLIAKNVMFALEHAGIKVFPNFNTAWHFDDKVAQKYLLEAINAPLVPSYVFYSKKEALKWATQTTFPKVFKLKGGAGASNVKLLRNHSQCITHINKAFGRGFSQFNRLGYLNDSFKKFRKNKDFRILLKGVYRAVIPTKFARLASKERGYFYCQEFIPNNLFDIRVIVIDEKAFAVKRFVRKNDFRASGSGILAYDIEQIPIECVKISLDVAEKLNLQCVGFDFVLDENNRPLIVEMGYGFSVKAYDHCEGYWNRDLSFVRRSFNPQHWMVASLIKTV